MITNQVREKRLLCFLRKVFTLVVVIYLSSASFSFAQPVSFAPATNFAVGTTPTSVAIADLNGDGKFDLAVTNGNSLDVSVLLGTGTGAFGPAANFAVGTVPRSVAIADLNADGKLDLVVANGGSNDVSVLLGTGTGTFGPATPFSVGTGPSSVVIGDLNGDGNPDLAVAQSNNVSVLLGTGTGTFGPATPFSVGTGATSVVIGDLNGDGNPDLAVSNAESNDVSILIGTGTGSFGVAANFPVGLRPWSVALGDLNGDGKPDLAVANSDSNSVSILLGTGTGSFGVAANFPVRTVPISVAIGDLNGDGKPDLAVANLTSNEVATLLGTGTGSFGVATNFAVETNPQSVAIEDLDLDGKPDLVVANAGSNNVSILLNTTTTVLDQEPPNTSITFGPAGTITVSSATFTWTGSDNATPPENLVYAYRLNPIEASFSAFGSARMKSYTNLPNGNYTFYVKAKDLAGNEDQTPDTRNFTVNNNSPDITITPTSLSFGYLQFNKDSAKQIVTVTNVGPANLIIGTIILGGANANQFEVGSDKCSNKTLATTRSCTLSVGFKPTSTGAKTATLIVPSNDPDESTLNLSLSGIGAIEVAPDITVTPTALNFGNVAVGQISGVQNVTIKNDGNAKLKLQGWSVSNSGVFQVDSIGLPDLEPNASVTAGIRFKPQFSGIDTGFLKIKSDDRDEPSVVVSFIGTGTP